MADKSMLQRAVEGVFGPRRRRVVISPDLAATNELLSRQAVALERQAAALERILLLAFDYDITKEGLPPAAEPQRPKQPPIPLPPDLDEEDIIAAIEQAEADGIEVPLDSYERWGIEPPDHRQLGEVDYPVPVDGDEQDLKGQQITSDAEGLSDIDNDIIEAIADEEKENGS